MHKHHGNKWTLISKNLAGRSDNDVKNHWYSTITRKFQIHGTDKLTTAAIQQVFMLVTAGIISRDLVKDWPGAPNIQPSPHPYPFSRHDGYHYGYMVPPNNNAYHMPHSMPYSQSPSGAKEGGHSNSSPNGEGTVKCNAAGLAGGEDEN